VSLSPFWRENKGIPPEEVKHITCADILARVWSTIVVTLSNVLKLYKKKMFS